LIWPCGPTHHLSQRRLHWSVFAANFRLAEVAGSVVQLWIVRPIMRAMALTTSRPTCLVGKCAGGLFTVYVAVYLALTLCGGYQSVIWMSAAAHEDLMWAPLGFTGGDGTFRRSFVIAFYPLWVADISLIHKTKYNVHRPNTALEPAEPLAGRALSTLCG
jgi:hypothetical protein